VFTTNGTLSPVGCD